MKAGNFHSVQDYSTALMLQYQLLALLINFWVGSSVLQHAQNFSEYSFPLLFIYLYWQELIAELLVCFEASGF